MTSAAPLLLVTGATGNVGAPLISELRARGLPVAAANPRDADTVETRQLDFEDPSTFAGALEGVGRVFLMRPPQISDTKRYLRPFVAGMAAAGVEHVVFLSLMGVNRAMPHWQVEQDLRASTVPWTFLRPSFFAQNLGAAYRADIRDHDRIRLASGHGRTSFVDTRDVAEVAALVLADPTGHEAQAYTLTGPEALDYHQVASLLSAMLGRPIDYQAIGLLRYRRELRAQDLPGAYVNVQLLINVVARLGLAARVNDTIRTLLGRPPTTLAAYISDHRALWGADAP
jgi:uncharacterized protein YbjT (DUF2867 family)